MEIGPDETMPDTTETATLLQVVEGEEEAIRMDMSELPEKFLTRN